MRSPPKDSQTHAQNDNDLAKSGDSGNGRCFYKVIICLYYCNYHIKSGNEILVDPVNAHNDIQAN